MDVIFRKTVLSEWFGMYMSREFKGILLSRDLRI